MNLLFGSYLGAFLTQNLKAEYPFILKKFTPESLPHKAVLEIGRKGKQKRRHPSFLGVLLLASFRFM